MMDQKQLSYFLAIAEECSITKAAERLHVPQPYLSSQLKNMELELGVKLAVRNTRKLQLTDAGRQLQYRAVQILELMEVTGRELERFESGLQGTLTIGTIPTSAALLLTRTVQLFHRKFPDVRFEIRNLSTRKILESLKIGTIELGMIRTPLDSEEFETLYLEQQPMVAVCNMDFAKESKIIGLSDLSKKKLLVNYRFESIITDACRNAGFEPDILCKVDDTRSILMWASLGMGIAVIPKDWLTIVPGLQLSYREIAAPALATSSAVVWLKNRAISSAAGHFIEIFRGCETDPNNKMEGFL